MTTNTDQQAYKARHALLSRAEYIIELNIAIAAGIPLPHPSGGAVSFSAGPPSAEQARTANALLKAISPAIKLSDDNKILPWFDPQLTLIEPGKAVVLAMRTGQISLAECKELLEVLDSRADQHERQVLVKFIEDKQQ